VCTPRVFRSVYPCSAALEKYGKEALSSQELCFLSGSADGSWMLTSPTTRVGKGERHQQKYYPEFCGFCASDVQNAGTQIPNQDATTHPPNAPDTT